MVKKSIKIDPEHEEWLEENDWFNLSGAVRDMLDERIENGQ